MAQKTLAEEIITIIKAHSNDNPAPTTGTITRTYEESNYADVETEDGVHRYIPVIGENTVDTIGVIVYLDGDLNTPLMITSGGGGGSEVDIVTEWETTLSDTKVPSEKLVKTSIPSDVSDLTDNNNTAFTPKTHEHGNITNDGKVGSNANYFVTTTTDGAITTKQKIGYMTTTGAIGTTSGKPIITGVSGILTAGSFGTTSGTFAEGNHTHSYTDITDKPSIYTQTQIYDLIQDIYNTLINNTYHFYDKATTGNKNTNWENYSTRLTITTDDNGTLLTGKAGQNGYYFVNGNNKFIFTDYTCEFDVISVEGTVRWYYQNEGNSNANLFDINSYVTSANVDHFKITSINGELKVYVNDTLQTTKSQTVTGPYELGFRTINGTGNTIKYRNFHLYTNTTT